jgi:hypothetical protein
MLGHVAVRQSLREADQRILFSVGQSQAACQTPDGPNESRIPVVPQ